MSKIRLGVNIDHVATLRNARGGNFPCPVEAAKLAQKAGADGITAHLREDRRHILDKDLQRLKQEVSLPLNMEMAATMEMLDIALKLKPNAVCLVPEKREELTTEGGLDVATRVDFFLDYSKKLKDNGIRVSLFLDANKQQIDAAKHIGADIIELHTGAYANNKAGELDKLINAAKLIDGHGIEVHAGHGLNYANTPAMLQLQNLKELNIGHFLMGQAIFDGLETSIKKMINIIGAK